MLKLRYFGHLIRKANSLEKKDPDARKDGGKEKGATEDEMVGWHHWLNGHEFEQTQGDSERQGSLACYSSWGHKERDTHRVNTTTIPHWHIFVSWDHTSKQFQMVSSRGRCAHNLPQIPMLFFVALEILIRYPAGGPRNPLQYSCLENPMDRGTWPATVHRVTKSQTRLKWLSTHVRRF